MIFALSELGPTVGFVGCDFQFRLVALGGRGTKFGPIIGAVVVNLLKSYTTRAYPESWLLILGAVFVLVVLFMLAYYRVFGLCAVVALSANLVKDLAPGNHLAIGTKRQEIRTADVLVAEATFEFRPALH